MVVFLLNDMTEAERSARLVETIVESANERHALALTTIAARLRRAGGNRIQSIEIVSRLLRTADGEWAFTLIQLGMLIDDGVEAE